MGAEQRAAGKEPKFHFEFFGPIGTLGCTFALPLVVYALDYASNPRGCVSVARRSVPGWGPDTRLFSWEGLAVVYGWFALQLLLHLCMPARSAVGRKEPDGKVWAYRLNAFPNFVILYLAVAGLAFLTPYLPLYWAADHVLELATGAMVLATSMAITLFIVSFRKSAVLAAAGTSGYSSYDFWMGRELNPRIGSLDLKEFCELYPGLMGWAVLNLAFAHKQWVTEGQVSVPMILVNVFQLIYVLDGLFFESSILTTMDITTEGFGFMLTFGDLVWVPFTYCLQAKYIQQHATDLALPWAIGITLLNFVGYYTFRGANGQKDTFRKNPEHPSVAHIKTLPTARGTKLMCSGWWGVARHINYTGDWIMALAWCLTAGSGCIIPYFYAIYFAILLVHRDGRDDASCRAKYGQDWQKYCKIVPYRLIPGLY